MAVGGDDDMERDFAARLRLAHSPAPAASSAPPASSSPTAGGIAFRAPQEQFTIDDFELGKIYGVGSYSKVVNLPPFRLCIVVGIAVLNLRCMH